MKTPDEASPKAPTLDESGKPVEVVRRDVEDPTQATEGVDEVVTPTSTREKEQDAQTLEDKVNEIERNVADGN